MAQPPTSADDIVRLLADGTLREHRQSNVELKQSWFQNHGEKLSALANRTDSLPKWLVVGVGDDGALVGRDETWARRTEEAMSQQINASLNPMQACAGIVCREVSGAWVVIASIRNPGDVVYWGDRAFQAAGTTTQELAPDEVLRLRIQLPGLSDFSRQPAQGDCAPILVGRFGERIRRLATPLEGGDLGPREPSAVLRRLGIRGTQAERILFGDCTYRVVRYGPDGELVSNRSFRGMYQLLTDDFLSEMQGASAQAAGARVPYPARALREALANAVAHAAYFESDGDIIVEQHPEHVTIGNLCVPESVYFANRWFSRSHKTVNGLLMEILRVAGHVDELGRGKHLIFSESMKRGLKPPLVVVEHAGRCDRWKLTLYGGMQDATLLRLLDRCRAVYRDESKALIAQALVLWRDRPVSEIRNFIDGDFSRQFAEVLSGLEGPIFYYRDDDRITLRRWAQILLGEGKDSKAFSPAEKRNLLHFAGEMQTKYHDGYITPRDLRKLAAMADTKSEQVLSSAMLAQWQKEGIVRRVRRGHYRFTPRPAELTSLLGDLLERLGRPEAAKDESA